MLGAIMFGIIRSSPCLFTYDVICLQVKVRLGATLSAEIRSSAIFVDILRHLFTG